ncbi:MAG: hypothetical protein J7K68_06160 [Candidatus Diapherotrites archaeon]|nr:hypothetical protein [Candidatus Diapherotrites archaeon]
MEFEVKPIEKQHIGAIKQLFSEEGWHLENPHPENTLVLVNESDVVVVGGVHFDVLDNGTGESDI